jgi:nanoRNase/pAp phosphatase (c-di-AMP/oligoRNAs hydrolase)
MQHITDILQKANTILIATHENPTADSIGSTLSLYLALTSLGKKVTVALSEPITVDLSYFVGVNKIVSEINKKNFVISLDYEEGSIEKVSYNIDGNRFNLVIEPREGFDSFSKDKVHFSNAGSSFDAVITVDTISLGGLKKLYDQDKETFTSKPIINIDRHPNNGSYGKVNLVDAQASSTIEIVYELIESLGVNITQDIASNVLNALYVATQNFTSQQVTPKTFEIASKVVKAGGKRFRSSVAQATEEILSHEEVQVADEEEHVPPPAEHEAPPDWLKPKIFKSSNVGS